MTHDPRETLDAAVEAACHLVLQAQRDLHEWLEAKGYAEGYATALDAAREAALAVTRESGKRDMCAAMDTLREKMQ